MLDGDIAETATDRRSRGRTGLRWAGRILGAVVGVLVLAVAVLYLYPLGSDRLQNAEVTTLSFDAAVAAGEQARSRDTADAQVRPECRSQLRVHPNKTAKAVLMLHGYTSCPKDYSELAQLFYDRGYNVYVPRESHHGLQDVSESSRVKSEGLVDYADAGMDVVAGLGDEVGVIGLSGGGVLATWLAEYRTESVTHLLALAPFYQPDDSQAPSFLIKPAIVLFGSGLVPDRRIGDTNFTLVGLSQYLRIVRNYRDEPVNAKLRSAAVALSTEDPFIDQGLALKIPTTIAKANGLQLRSKEFGPELNLPHNIVAPDNLGADARTIEELYFTLYEG